MSFGVTPSGYNTKTLNDINNDMSVDIQNVVDPVTGENAQYIPDGSDIMTCIALLASAEGPPILVTLLTLHQLRISIGFSDGTNDRCFWFADQDAQGTSNADHRLETDSCMFTADHARTATSEASCSMTATGFTLDWTTAHTNANLGFWVAMQGASAPAGGGGSTGGQQGEAGGQQGE